MTSASLSSLLAAVVVGGVVTLVLAAPNPRTRLTQRSRSPLRFTQRWGRQRHRDDAIGMAVIDLLVSLAAEVRSGSDLAAAFARTTSESPALSDLRRSDLADSRHRALRLLAVTWQVHDHTGGPTVHALDTLLDLARADLRVQRAISTESSSAAATMVVLVALTPLAWLIGAGIGAQPLAWLIGSPLGWLVLLAGLGMTAAGISAVRIIVRRTRRRIQDAS